MAERTLTTWTVVATHRTNGKKKVRYTGKPEIRSEFGTHAEGETRNARASRQSVCGARPTSYLRRRASALPSRRSRCSKSCLCAIPSCSRISTSFFFCRGGACSKVFGESDTTTGSESGVPAGLFFLLLLWLFS
ncbi:hypothetical protein ACFX2F_037660 [Malus domestica]